MLWRCALATGSARNFALAAALFVYWVLGVAGVFDIGVAVHGLAVASAIALGLALRPNNRFPAAGAVSRRRAAQASARARLTGYRSAVPARPE